MKSNHIMITQFPKISAIYYGLLQSGYDYYSMERGPEHIDLLQSYVEKSFFPSFFSGARQSTCEVYPYWPRAFIMETASFYLNEDNTCYCDFGKFHHGIMSAGNITEKQRDDSLWHWISDFPTALAAVLSNHSFSKYMEWEKKWITEQNDVYRKELGLIKRCLDFCIHQWQSPVQRIQVCVNPIKCVYSADYFLFDTCFIFSSGAFRTDSIIHEFLHSVVHPVVEQQKEMILKWKPIDKQIDDSYYLSGNNAGIINAFEETVVRLLTKEVMNNEYPKDLLGYIKSILEKGKKI